jgi:hypothetical protein
VERKNRNKKSEAEKNGSLPVKSRHLTKEAAQLWDKGESTEANYSALGLVSNVGRLRNMAEGMEEDGKVENILAVPQAAPKRVKRLSQQVCLVIFYLAILTTRRRPI